MTIREYIKANPKAADQDNQTYYRQAAAALGVTRGAVKSKYNAILRQQKKSGNEKMPEGEVDARVLVFDIETAPLKAYVWSKWGQNIQDSFIIRDWFMLTWAAKWLFETMIYSERLTPEEVMAEDDSRITKTIWKLLDQANIIIAHNGVKFDIKRLNTRFLKHKLGHPSPYKVIDTLLHARKEFALTSNRLDYICKFLGIEGKEETEKGLWQKCSEGDKDALHAMEKYNIKDTKILEEVYLQLRPYLHSHPNVGLYIQDTLECCPACGNNRLTECGDYATSVNLYKAYRCDHCGAISRQRHSRLPVNEKRHLTQSTSK